MFSSALPGGSVCLRCQVGLISAASRRASPAFITAAQTSIRRNGTKATSSKTPPAGDSFEDIIARQRREDEETKDQFGGFEELEGPSSKWRRPKAVARRGYPEHRQQRFQERRNQEPCYQQTRYQEPRDKRYQKPYEQPDEEPHDQDPQQEDDLPEEEEIYQRLIQKAQQNRGPKKPFTRKFYKSRGCRMLVESEELSIGILGTPANAILLKDGGLLQVPELPPLFESPFEEPSAPIDMEGILEKEAEALGLEEVWENIDGLLPEDDIIPARQFKQLHETLVNGFTIAQMESYMDYYREKKLLRKTDEEELPQNVLDMPGTYPWVVRQWHWTPDVPDAVENIGYPLRGYIVKGMTAKEKFVMRLIRECWGISIHELMDSHGRLDVRVRDLEFSLLLLGTQRWLQGISRAFLKPGKQIEMIRSENLIRIVAPKAVAETILGEINKTLQNVKSGSFSIDQLQVRPLDDTLLKEVGRITNSHVELSDSGEEVRVTWIETFTRIEGTKTENLKDIVFRLLVSAKPPARVSHKLTVHGGFSKSARFMTDYGSKDKLAWMDRQKNWARLCFPVQDKKLREVSDAPHADTLTYEIVIYPEDVVRPDLVNPEKVQEEFGAFKFPKPPPPPPGPELTKPTSSGWMPYRVATHAVFGHILHLQKPGPIDAVIKATTPPSASSSRVIAPLIPAVSSLALNSWVPYPRPIFKTSNVLMRFVPATGQKFATSQSPPPLELRLSSADDQIIRIQSLRAVPNVSVCDMLLPQHYIDVRTTQTMYAELPGTSFGTVKGIDPLATFLKDSRLEPSEGFLETPARIFQLGLPKWLLHANEKVVEPSAAAAFNIAMHETNQSMEMVPVDYVFAGLEVHRPVETTYDGWKLVYTSIEAGRGGGRRAELSLEAVPGFDQYLRRDPKDVDRTHFVRSLYRLATGYAKSGDGEKYITWVGANNVKLL